MGLIKSTLSSMGQSVKGTFGNVLGGVSSGVNTVLGDVAAREFFYCDAFPNDILIQKGRKRDQKGNNKGSDNIISNGSVVIVNEGQCMILVDQGKITEVCAEPGEFVYDASTEPSIFYGNLGENIKNSFIQLGKRISFGGEIPKDQRVYYVNLLEIRNNLWGTAGTFPFFIHDKVTGFQGDINIMCNGEFTYTIVDPLSFCTTAVLSITERIMAIPVSLLAENPSTSPISVFRCFSKAA